MLAEEQVVAALAQEGIVTALTGQRIQRVSQGLRVGLGVRKNVRRSQGLGRTLQLCGSQAR